MMREASFMSEEQQTQSDYKIAPIPKTPPEPQPTLYPMGLWALNSEKYQLKHYPIQIVIEEWPENEYIARWHDVEAVGFGEGKEEAIADLCECIVDLYERLSNTADEKLGKIPHRAKYILQKVIEKKSGVIHAFLCNFRP